VEASSQVEPMLPGSSHSSALIQTRNQLGITPPAPAPVSCAAVYGAALYRAALCKRRVHLLRVLRCCAAHCARRLNSMAFNV